MHSLSVYWRSWTIGRYLHQTWTVLIFLYGRRGYRAWFLDAILGFSDSTLRLSLSGYQFKTLFSEMIVGECVQAHSQCIWSILYASELVYDVFWTSVSILDFAAYIVRCLQTFDIVLSMWDTPALWGQCLRILFDLWVFDLEVCLVTFTTLTLCWHLVIVVSELRLRYYCIWLSFSREVEQNILLSMLVWSSETLSLCVELIWRWNMRFQWCSVLQESFVKEFEWIISFLSSRVTSLDIW